MRDICRIPCWHMPLRLLASAFLVIGGTTSAIAQEWPTQKPIQVIVPFTPGSAVDVVARLVLHKVGEQIGQTFIIDNRSGAGGTLGMAVVAKAEPDGYTLLASSSAHTITPSIYKNLPYDAKKAFVGIIPFGNLPNVLVVNPSKYRTLQELMAAAKSRPGEIMYGSGGVGAVAHLNAERLRLAAGVELRHIPFRGAPAALTEVVAGRVDFYFSPLSAAIPLIQDGQLRALAVSTAKRSPALPDVPTTIEAGFKDSDYTFWAGLCAPAGTPPAIIARLHRETAKALALPDIQAQLAKLGVEPMPMTSAEFDSYLKMEIDMNAKIVKAAGIEMN